MTWQNMSKILVQMNEYICVNPNKQIFFSIFHHMCNDIHSTTGRRRKEEEKEEEGEEEEEEDEEDKEEKEEEENEAAVESLYASLKNLQVSSLHFASISKHLHTEMPYRAFEAFL